MCGPADRELGTTLLAGGELKLSDPLRVSLRLPDACRSGARVRARQGRPRPARVARGRRCRHARPRLAPGPGDPGQPGRSRARERRPQRRGTPSRQRGALLLLGAELERPHHGARRRHADRLPEPVGRAGSRVHRRGAHRGVLRACAASERQRAPAPAPQGRWPDPQSPGADRVPALAQGRQHPPFRDPAQQPARGQRGAGRRAQRPRRQRAQGVRGAALPPGLP